MVEPSRKFGFAIRAVPLVRPLERETGSGPGGAAPISVDGYRPDAGRNGWLISPTPLRLPLLKRSERRCRRAYYLLWCWRG
jgi:hypothetical protein